MFLVPLTFILILAIVVGLYWIFVAGPEQQAESKLRRRLRAPSSAPKSGALLKPLERMSSIDALDASFRRLLGILSPLQRTIQQSGLRTNLGTVLLASGVAAFGAYQIVFLLTRAAGIAVLFGLFAAMVPTFYVRHARNKRLAKFEEQFPEAIDLLGRALRAGHALTTGLGMVADELPDPVGTEFRQLFDQQNFGLPLPEALKNFAERVPMIDAKFFVTAVLTQREAGGNLSEVLDNLAAIIRDRFRVKRQVRVISAHGRITGWVLGCLPPALAIGFVILTPESYKRFYSDPLGVQMIAVALLLQVIGVLIIRRIVDIEY